MELQTDIHELRITEALEAYRHFDTNESEGISPDEAEAMSDGDVSRLLNDAYFSEDGGDGNNRVAFFKGIAQNGRLSDLFFETTYLKELAAQNPKIVGENFQAILEMGAGICIAVDATDWVDTLFISMLEKKLTPAVLYEMEEKNPEFVLNRKRIPYSGNLLSADLNKNHFIETGEIRKYEAEKPWRDRLSEFFTKNLADYPLAGVVESLVEGLFDSDQIVAALQMISELPLSFRIKIAIDALAKAHLHDDPDAKEILSRAVTTTQFAFDPEGFLEIIVALQEMNHEVMKKMAERLVNHLDADSKMALIKLDAEKYEEAHFGIEKRFFLMIPGTDLDKFCPPMENPKKELPPGMKDI